MLLDVPMMGKKFAAFFTPADQEIMAEMMPQMNLAGSTESKSVLGRKAVKYAVSDNKTRNNFDVWFTKDLEITGNPLVVFTKKI